MNINELSMRIQDKYRQTLTDFRRKILGEEGRSTALNQNDPHREIPSIGRIRSLEDKHVELTIVADAADLDWFAEDPALEGTCITVSMAGHHRLLGSRTSLPTGECDAWLRAILGAHWADHAYRAGTLSGVDGRLSTVYYRLFLDGDDCPMLRPDSYKERGLRKMSEL